MEQVLAKAEIEDRWRYEQLTELMAKPCWRLCGIAPWNTSADHLVEEIQRTESLAGANPRHSTLDPDQCTDETWNGQRIVAYTDGSSIDIEYSQYIRAGWGIFYGKGHPLNACGPVETRSQTSYRGELRAIAHAINTSSVPIEMVTDCLTIVHQLTSIISAHADGLPPPRQGNAKDLWSIIAARVYEAPTHFYKVRWTKAHLFCFVRPILQRAVHN